MTILILVAIAFAATNVDNLLILMGWIMVGGLHLRRIAWGYALATLGVLMLSLAIGVSAIAIPVQYVGYLGLIPILLGMKMLIELVRRNGTEPVVARAGGVTTLAVAAMLFSNSVDTVLVFAPLFADSNDAADYLIVAGFAAMATLWFVLAGSLSRRAANLQPLSDAMRWLAPLIMIIVGCYILNNTATDIVAGS